MEKKIETSLMELSEHYDNVEVIEVKMEITDFEEMPDIDFKDELDYLHCANFDTLPVNDVKMDIEIGRVEIGEPEDISENLDRDNQTERRVQEMVASWGIVTWEEYSTQYSFPKFWRETFVLNVRSAVRLNFMTRKGGAALLGIQASIFRVEKSKFAVKGFPAIAQDMVDRWGIVRKDEYLGMGRSDEEFWKETFVKNVLYAVQRDFLSRNGGALLLGVDVGSLEKKLRKAFGKLPLTEKGTVSHKKPPSLHNLELLNKNWWLNLGPADLKCTDMEDIVDDKSRIIRHWIVFLQFSQVEIRVSCAKSKFNPYKASMQEVADFLQFLHLTNNFNESNRPNDILASLGVYLPELAQTSVMELLNNHIPTLVLNDLKLVKKLLPISPFDSTWSSFVKFCQKIEEKNFIQVDPFLAKPGFVIDFLIYKFQVKELRVEEVESKPFFKPAYNFCSENLNRVLSELDWHLEHSWLKGALKTCEEKEMEKLVSAAYNCDERLVTQVSDFAFKLSPNYSYTKFRTSDFASYSEDQFWDRKFTANVLKDVKSKVFPVSVAASGLGVTSEMVYSALMQGKSLEQDKISVKDYVNLGFGSKSQFWKEESILKLLEDVRNRKTTVEEISAQFGVSRREIIEKCGGVKEVSEIEAEMTLSMIQKMKEQAENGLVVKKKQTQLEEQIEMAEKDLDKLSEYEKMRLRNMKERQALVKSLDFDKEKREIRAMTPKNKSRQVKTVELREKSARVKRRSEVQQLKQQEGSNLEISKSLWTRIQDQRSSSKWFSHWIPRDRIRQSNTARKSITDIDINDVYDEEAIRKSNHVPKFELSAPELLEITPIYHKSRTLLDSFSEEFKQIEVEEKLQTKVDWSKFELVHDSMVSTSELTSLDSCNDFFCFGTKCGGVGVFLAGRSFTLRPHNRKVTRTLFTGDKSCPKIISAGLDGTVRMTDLGHQSICLEYSWDQSYSGKQGVNWLEERGVYSFLMDCGGEINQIDIRSKEAMNLIQLTDEQTGTYNNTNLSVNPANKNLISLCRGQSVQIWDLRKASQPVNTLTSASAWSMAGGGWSVSGSYLVTCVQGYTGRAVPVLYSGKDFSQPLLTWEGPRKTTFFPSTGVTWCPWDERVFLITLQQPKMYLGQDFKVEPKQGIVAVDCNSGAVVGDLSAGLDNSTFMVHCHKTRQVVMVGNSKGPGGLAIFKVTEDVNN